MSLFHRSQKRLKERKREEKQARKAQRKLERKEGLPGEPPEGGDAEAQEAELSPGEDAQALSEGEAPPTPEGLPAE